MSFLHCIFKIQAQLSAEQKSGALPSVPSLLEVFGFSYFYGGFLVGPQFTLRSYQRLVGRELTDCPGKPPNRWNRNKTPRVTKRRMSSDTILIRSVFKKDKVTFPLTFLFFHSFSFHFCSSVLPAMKRFSLGFLCLAIYAIFSPSYPDSYYLTDEYEVRIRTQCAKNLYQPVDQIEEF